MKNITKIKKLLKTLNIGYIIKLFLMMIRTIHKIAIYYQNILINQWNNN